jgi:hypothetical protein
MIAPRPLLAVVALSAPLACGGPRPKPVQPAPVKDRPQPAAHLPRDDTLVVSPERGGLVIVRDSAG